jgi:uncharacterized protein (DUF58 family)
MSFSLSQRLSIKRFTRGESPQHSSIRLNHRRIFILPSKGGLALGLVILLMLIASINYNNSMGFVFTFLLAAAAQASTLYSYKNLSGLVISISKTPPLFSGTSSNVNVLIKEASQRQRWAINIKHQNNSDDINLQASQNQIVNLPITPTKRGWYTLDTVTLYSQFPFGFFRAWSPLQFNTPILVYPTPIDADLSLPLKNSNESNASIASLDSGTDDFAGFKPYQTGHSYRHINWKAFAAEKGLYTNEFSADQSATIWLDWAACANLSLESTISQLCFWVLAAEKNGLSYGLQLPTVNIEPSTGLNHQHSCLKALALYE